MARGYAIDAQRLVTRESRGDRPLCACVQVGRGGRLFAWTGCARCRGTGGEGSTAEPSQIRNSSSHAEGM